MEEFWLFVILVYKSAQFVLQNICVSHREALICVQ